MFSLSGHERGQGNLGLYGNRTCTETPGPGSYDPHPLIGPTAHRTTRSKYYPDRAPGFIGTVGRPSSLKWRPEPFSLSCQQREQPLVHYASATFWDHHPKMTTTRTRREKLPSLARSSTDGFLNATNPMRQ
mmetsp:Transcript_78274/g.176880  ORF Transcript_78274/g.176880 Transcript_78274/m.176880 type:complete len:131 (-) Transcript_78274:104-496(-)